MWVALVLLLVCWARPVAAATETLQWERSDGTRLIAYLDRPQRATFPLVLVLQGSEALSVADKYGPYRDYLVRQGTGVLRIEKIGLEPGARGATAEYLATNTVPQRVLDVLDVIAHLRREGRGWDGRLVVMGGSEGGMVAALAAPLIPECRAVCLLVCGGDWTFQEELIYQIEQEALAGGADSATLLAIRGQVEGLGRESLAQPLPGREWGSDGKLARNTYLWWSRALPLRLGIPLSELEVPIRLTLGGADHSTPPQSVAALQTRFRRLGKTNLEVCTYPGVTHDLAGSAEGRRAIQDSVEWAQARLSAGR